MDLGHFNQEAMELAEKCCHCKRRLARPCATIRFEYRGMKFTTFRAGSSCTECAKEHSIEHYEKVPAGVITPMQGHLPEIDWRKYLEIDRGDRDHHGGPFDQATHVLLELGVLVYEEGSDNYWQVFGCGMSLGPSYGMMGFVRKKDAEEYAKIKYAKAVYEVRISQIRSTKIKRKK